MLERLDDSECACAVLLDVERFELDDEATGAPSASELRFRPLRRVLVLSSNSEAAETGVGSVGVVSVSSRRVEDEPRSRRERLEVLLEAAVAAEVTEARRVPLP